MRVAAQQPREDVSPQSTTRGHRTATAAYTHGSLNLSSTSCVTSHPFFHEHTSPIGPGTEKGTSCSQHHPPTETVLTTHREQISLRDPPAPQGSFVPSFPSVVSGSIRRAIVKVSVCNPSIADRPPSCPAPHAMGTRSVHRRTLHGPCGRKSHWRNLDKKAQPLLGFRSCFATAQCRKGF